MYAFCFWTHWDMNVIAYEWEGREQERKCINKIENRKLVPLAHLSSKNRTKTYSIFLVDFVSFYVFFRFFFFINFVRSLICSATFTGGRNSEWNKNENKITLTTISLLQVIDNNFCLLHSSFRLLFIIYTYKSIKHDSVLFVFPSLSFSSIDGETVFFVFKGFVLFIQNFFICISAGS